MRFGTGPKGVKRCQTAFFQEHEPLQVVSGCFELQGESGSHYGQTAYQFAAHFRWRAGPVLDASGQRVKVDMPGQFYQRIAQLRAPVLALMLCKQADSGLHHRGTRLVRSQNFIEAVSRWRRLLEVPLRSASHILLPGHHRLPSMPLPLQYGLSRAKTPT